MGQRTVRVKPILTRRNNYVWIYIATGLLVVSLVGLIVFVNAQGKKEQPERVIVQTQLPTVIVRELVITATPALIVNPLATVTALPTNTLLPTITPTPTPRPPHSPSPYEYNQTYAAGTAAAKE